MPADVTVYLFLYTSEFYRFYRDRFLRRNSFSLCFFSLARSLVVKRLPVPFFIFGPRLPGSSIPEFCNSRIAFHIGWIERTERLEGCFHFIFAFVHGFGHRIDHVI